MAIIGTTIKSGSYKITIKNQFGRWLVGHNRTLGWCVLNRDTNEVATVHESRKLAEKRAENLIIRDRDQAKAAQPSPAATPERFGVEGQDPRTGDWHPILSSAEHERAVDVAARLIAEGYGARLVRKAA